nr:hypothetical protein [Tanacetum cinerariifolium]
MEVERMKLSCTWGVWDKPWDMTCGNRFVVLGGISFKENRRWSYECKSGVKSSAWVGDESCVGDFVRLESICEMVLDG